MSMCNTTIKDVSNYRVKEYFNPMQRITKFQPQFKRFGFWWDCQLMGPYTSLREAWIAIYHVEKAVQLNLHQTKYHYPSLEQQ